ncbi:MAG: hypothetical protein JRD69_10340, partial [Deltaproteobacteria bacterium]|nr:hypothetical protein [Deltaproteobacteria bacterium]
MYWELDYHQPIFANQYVVLVAQSAGCRKGAAAKISMRLLKDVPNVSFMDKKITHQYLLVKLFELNEAGKDAAASVFCEELATFITTKALLQENFATTLIQLYDGDDVPYGTKTAGQFPVVRSCLNIIGCSTPQLLRQCMPGEIMGSGLEGRTVFVVGLEKDKSISRPRNIMPSRAIMDKTKDDLTHDLIVMSNISGEIDFDSEAGDWYD